MCKRLGTQSTNILQSPAMLHTTTTRKHGARHSGSPLPFAATPPVGTHGSSGTRSRTAVVTWMAQGGQVDSQRLAVLMVSPNRQKRGMRVPTTPLVTGPVWMPTRTCGPALVTVVAR